MLLEGKVVVITGVGCLVPDGAVTHLARITTVRQDLDGHAFRAWKDATFDGNPYPPILSHDKHNTRFVTCLDPDIKARDATLVLTKLMWG